MHASIFKKSFFHTGNFRITTLEKFRIDPKSMLYSSDLRFIFKEGSKNCLENHKSILINLYRFIISTKYYD